MRPATRLALAPVRFAAGAGGSTSVSTSALLDGPFPGGRVRGLRIPIDARFGGAARLRFGRPASRRASPISAWAALQFGATRACRSARSGRPSPGRRRAGAAGRRHAAPADLCRQARPVAGAHFGSLGADAARAFRLVRFRHAHRQGRGADHLRGRHAGRHFFGRAARSPAANVDLSAGCRCRSAKPAATGGWAMATSPSTADCCCPTAPTRPILSAAQRRFHFPAGRRPYPRHRHAAASGQRHAGHRRHDRASTCRPAPATRCSTCPASPSAQASSPRS